jgi:hypothetical protein
MKTAVVRMAFTKGRRLHLHPPEFTLVTDKEIVGFAVAPRFADRESMLRCASHETEFRPFSSPFVVFDTRTGNFHRNLNPIKNAAPKGSRVLKNHYISRISVCRG